MANYEKKLMLRVNKEHRCPVCGKPDWCLVAQDRSAAICARVEQGSRKRCGDAGWLHVFAERTGFSPQTSGIRKRGGANHPGLKVTGPCKGGVPIDFARMAEVFASRCSEWRVRFLANSLALTPGSLKRLGIGISAGGFTFPMSDEHGNIIGIRRRFDNGRKNSVKGSKNGLFIPTGIDKATKLIICEGPTDCAAALDLGWAAIGRPNCNSKLAMTVRYVRGRPVVIVADRDAAGIRGARKLTDALLKNGSTVRIILPPPIYKDLRQWKEHRGRIIL
ncbi:MAG: toprim domain-containing protein [Planctomycetota bacterium]|jgi:hypothetical protein